MNETQERSPTPTRKIGRPVGSRTTRSARALERRLAEFDKRRQGQLYSPTAKDTETVRRMASRGAPQRMIADALGLSLPTLRKYFRNELDQGMALANFRLVDAMQTRGENPDGGMVAAVAGMYLLKVRAQMYDQPAKAEAVVRHEHRHSAVRAKLADVDDAELARRLGVALPQTPAPPRLIEGKVERE